MSVFIYRFGVFLDQWEHYKSQLPCEGDYVSIRGDISHYRVIKRTFFIDLVRLDVE